PSASRIVRMARAVHGAVSWVATRAVAPRASAATTQARNGARRATLAGAAPPRWRRLAVACAAMELRRRSWVRAAVVLALPFAALSALFPRAVWRGESFWVSDLGAFHRPIRSLLIRLAHESGGLPLWNPYLALGQPYAANPHYAVFHPTTALFFLLPLETAFRWQVMLPLLRALFAMVFFLRARPLRLRVAPLRAGL